MGFLVSVEWICAVGADLSWLLAHPKSHPVFKLAIHQTWSPDSLLELNVLTDLVAL